MKMISIACRLSCVRVFPVNRIPAGLPLGALALAVILFGGAATGHAAADVTEENAIFGEQSQGSLVSEEEENAYRAARRETDPQKRAQKLFEFIQKYPKSALIQQADYEETKAIEDEYNAYYAAAQEPDYAKRAAMLIEFLQKSPKSTLTTNAGNDYLQMLRDASQGKKYELLQSLAENWL